jgi:formate dehydrogenase-N alpha subunit
MTSHWIDMINADVVMICGSNAAENHPISMRWIRRAREHGCIILSVDPRYTRTSSFADNYCKFRSGTDIALVGGIINYALQNDRIQKDYVVNYTNASFIINGNYTFEDGMFAGYDGKKYDTSKWVYEMDENGIPKRDNTLQDPRCVYQLMKKHYSRYDADTVARITGAPKDDFLKIAEIYTSTYKPDKVGTWLYAMGTTQHTHGTQNIRTYAMLQLLLGNIGLAGGGVNALRGESNVQGSTDHCLLFHILPGYLATPTTAHTDLATYLDKTTPKTNDPMSANWWSNTPKYVVSLLKAFWGPAATKENNFAYDWLPKRNANHSHMHIFEEMLAGKIKGGFFWGQNPAVAGPNSNLERDALAKLEWMVMVELWETETATFWKRPGVDPKSINTEVFLLPAAASVEKEGSISNSGRWAQWRYKSQEPPGMAKSDAWIIGQLVKKFKKLMPSLDTTGVKEPLTNLYWNYGYHADPDVSMIAKEISGYYMEDVKDEAGNILFKKGQQCKNFTALTDNGATCSGNWLYSGSFTDDTNMMARRGSEDAINNIGLYPGWSWCWPLNRRIIYNRASVDPTGKPWDPKRWVIRWNPALAEGKGGWEGDVPDGGWAPGTKNPFIMRPEGVGCLWATALADGPLPEHYEPTESPTHNMMSNTQNNPTAFYFGTKSMVANPEYPIVCTTYRVSEHWQAGAMTRNLPWLSELVPSVFAEISEDFANRLLIKNGDKVKIETIRGGMNAYALVTKRFQPFMVNGKQVDQIGVVWHFGYEGIAKGDSANILTPHAGDANTVIPEFKAFMCKIRKVV